MLANQQRHTAQSKPGTPDLARERWKKIVTGLKSKPYLMSIDDDDNPQLIQTCTYKKKLKTTCYKGSRALGGQTCPWLSAGHVRTGADKFN
jgi:hypothetical protein